VGRTPLLNRQSRFPWKIYRGKEDGWGTGKRKGERGKRKWERENKKQETDDGRRERLKIVNQWI